MTLKKKEDGAFFRIIHRQWWHGRLNFHWWSSPGNDTSIAKKESANGGEKQAQDAM